MKNIRVFLSENFQILEVKFSVYLNRRVFAMTCITDPKPLRKMGLLYTEKKVLLSQRGINNLTELYPLNE